jgi:hypothetical protein
VALLDGIFEHPDILSISTPYGRFGQIAAVNWIFPQPTKRIIEIFPIAMTAATVCG